MYAFVVNEIIRTETLFTLRKWPIQCEPPPLSILCLEPEIQAP